jgi:aspartate kinase
MAALVIQKYGGSSVESLERIQNVAHHVARTRRDGTRLIVAISAMGEQTDELLAMAQRLSARPPRRELDMLLTAGERISAALLSIALSDLGAPALSLTGSQCGILTDETHGNARVHKILGDRIRDGLDAGQVVIVAGFQGVSPRTKEITTLGRGGTDLSAIALAAALGAERCELYKDVRGVYTADPRVVSKARVIPTLSFGAMNELAWAGASVLHPRGAHLAAKFGKKFEIRSSLELDVRGTVVGGEERTMESPVVEAIAHRKGVSLVACRVEGGGGAGVIAGALAWLWSHGEAPQACQQLQDGAAVTLVAAVKSELAGDLLAYLEKSAGDSGARLSVLRREGGLASLTVVGSGFHQSPETIAKLTAALGAPPVLLEPRNTSIVAIVREDELTAKLAAAHQILLEHS